MALPRGRGGALGCSGWAASVRAQGCGPVARSCTPLFWPHADQEGRKPGALMCGGKPAWRDKTPIAPQRTVGLGNK